MSYKKAKAIVTSNSIATNPLPASLFVGGAGNVSVGMPDGSNVVFSNVAAGTILPVSPKFVYTNTTATLIIGLR